MNKGPMILQTELQLRNILNETRMQKESCVCVKFPETTTKIVATSNPYSRAIRKDVDSAVPRLIAALFMASTNFPIVIGDHTKHKKMIRSTV